MGEDYRAKVFKSGNSLALRLPKALGLTEGTEMAVREEQGRYTFEPVRGQAGQRIDLTGIYGSDARTEAVEARDERLEFEPARPGLGWQAASWRLSDAVYLRGYANILRLPPRRCGRAGLRAADGVASTGIGELVTSVHVRSAEAMVGARFNEQELALGRTVSTSSLPLPVMPIWMKAAATLRTRNSRIRRGKLRSAGSPRIHCRWG